MNWTNICTQGHSAGSDGHTSRGSCCIQELDEAERNQFQDLLPPMLSAMGAVLNDGDETAAQDALELFVEMADTNPKFMRKHGSDIISAMLQVCCCSAIAYVILSEHVRSGMHAATVNCKMFFWHFTACSAAAVDSKGSRKLTQRGPQAKCRCLKRQKFLLQHREPPAGYFI